MEHVCAGLRRERMLLEMDDSTPYPRVWRLFRIACTDSTLTEVIVAAAYLKNCPFCGQTLPPWPDCPPSVVVVT